MKIEVSRHAKMRAYERRGIPSSKLPRIADRAWRNGVHHTDAEGVLGEHIKQRAEVSRFSQGEATVLVAHLGLLWVFGRDRFRNADMVLLTVLPMRDRLRNQIRRERQKAFRKTQPRWERDE